MAGALPDTNAREWRGRSGRVYGVRVHAAKEMANAGARAGIALAVKRDKAGHARPATKPTARITPEWISAALSSGATEIHVHQPAEGADPTPILNDLRGW